MKKTLAIIFGILFIVNAYAQEETVKGIYYNTEKTSKIKIFKATNGKYYGKVVWLEEAEKKDIHNPDESKRNNPLMGIMLINNFTYDAENKQWSGGKIYDPGNGKTYDCFMWFEGNNTEVLNVKGYIMGMKFAGRQVEWERTSLD